MRAIKAPDVKVRQINRLFLSHTISADYHTPEGQTYFGLIINLRRRRGQLEGKLKGSGHWVALKTVYIQRAKPVTLPLHPRVSFS